MGSFNIKNTRIIHMERIVPGEKADLDIRNSTRYKERGFMGIGYYDKMTYVRAKEDTFNYNHCFLIKYPYSKIEYKMLADQMFVLLDEKEDLKENNVQEDPFEYQDQEKLKPFLEIILVTVYKDDDKSISFDDILNGCKSRIEAVLEEEVYSEDITRIFWTPNCADLCVAIRTDKLDHLFWLKESISNINKCKYTDKEDVKIGIHTIGYSFLAVETGSISKDLVEKNQDNYMELRMTGPAKIFKEIEGKLKAKSVYGINGVGDWALSVSFPEFAEIYPMLIGQKFKWGIEAEKENENDTEDETLRGIFQRNKEKLQCLYIRPRFSMRKDQDDSFTQGKPSEWTNDVMERYKSRIDRLLSDASGRNTIYELQLCDQLTLVKELLYTYSDFLYQKSSEWKGIIFYSQIECLLSGIEKGMYEIDAIEDMPTKQLYASKLIRDSNRAVACINGFNKLLQSINQYVTNVPNYEVQAKVNIEKYLMAYTMYLWEISKRYYCSNKDEMGLKERIFPLFTIDLTMLNIEAETLFGQPSIKENTEKNLEGEWDVFFCVLCQDYQWFANIYHVLPMITHEISHNFRYLVKREERNLFVLELLTRYISYYISDQLSADKLNRNMAAYKSHTITFLLEELKEELYSSVYEVLKPELSHIRLNDMSDRIMGALHDVLGISSIDERARVRLWDCCGENLVKMAELSQMEFIIPDGPGRITPEIKGIEKYNVILVNMVISILKEDEEACQNWEKMLKGCCSNDDFEKGSEENFENNPEKIYIKFLLEILEDYSENHCLKTDIPKKIMYILFKELLIKTRQRWAKKSKDLIKLIDSIEENLFENSDEQAKKIEGILNRLVDRSVKGKMSIEEAQTLEDIMLFYHLALDLMASLQWNRDKVIHKEIDIASDFRKRLHRRYHKKYLKLCRQADGHSQWIFTQENQKMFLSMGIANEDSEQFSKYFRKFIELIPFASINWMTEDYIQTYQEIFADISMCCAFGFTAYGYFMYSIHIFMKEREICAIPSKEFTGNRFNVIILTLIKSQDQKEEFEASLFHYVNKLWKKITGEETILERFSDLKEEDLDLLEETSRETFSGKEMDVVKRQLKMLKWMFNLYSNMSFEPDADNEIKKKLIEHTRQIKKLIDQQSWIKNCSENSVVRDIGDYYNNYSIELAEEQKRLGRCLEIQHEFVKQYYEKMQDCVSRVKEYAASDENWEEGLLASWFEDEEVRE